MESCGLVLARYLTVRFFSLSLTAVAMPRAESRCFRLTRNVVCFCYALSQREGNSGAGCWFAVCVCRVGIFLRSASIVLSLAKKLELLAAKKKAV